MPTSRPSSPTTPPRIYTPEKPRTTTQRPRPTSYFASFVRWLQLKKYQYEVTFSLYMLTSTEKIIFNFIILTLLFLLISAATLYLPDHIAVIYNRIWYYVHGELISPHSHSETAKTSVAAALRGLSSTGSVAMETGSKISRGRVGEL